MATFVDSRIRVRSCPQCPLCNGSGAMLYQNLNDRLFGVEGYWNLSKCLNSTCESVWLNPMPVEEDIPKAYLNYYTHKVHGQKIEDGLVRQLYRRAKRGYLSTRYGYYNSEAPFVDLLMGGLIFLLPWKRAVIDFEVFHLKAKKGGSLLEVGCGSGTMLEAMVEHGWHAEGLDFDYSAVENARSKGLTVHQGSLEAQGFSSDTFDAVVMSHVIEHLPSPKTILQECNRILKPGGYLVLITPNAESLGHHLFKSNWRGLEPPRHLLLFNQRNIHGLAVDCGYFDVSTKTTIRDAKGLFLMSCAIANNDCPQSVAVKTRKVRLLGSAMQFVEWLLLKFNKSIGEELVLIARK